ncbi:hypothetical protein SAMN04488057_101308 [Cyclobacterium lianum]|uniref:DUF4249 domain-containing protein n=1 Tax=Cyclobacterium lianum TaxID=388280 RepID=A0A1M7IF87_9BACT|nr:hypothetical protein [Cyclobacterium lianum]SHM39434.1 hypothetical protein SAMN04488057_101308 [Cyclobacterium lianum]
MKIKSHVLILMAGLSTLFTACIEEDSIKEPDYEIGIIARATIAPGKYWFNINELSSSEVSFDLSYEGFEVHTASSIELFLSRGSDQVSLGTYTEFPSTINLTGEEAYAYFGETPASILASGISRDEFRITYEITTTEGETFSRYGQYYNYNPSLDGRFTGRYAQFYTNLPGFGTLVLDVRPPNPQNPNEE